MFATAQEPGSEVQEEKHAGARHTSMIGVHSLWDNNPWQKKKGEEVRTNIEDRQGGH